jgi:4-amino-4-deoxy-L-arabinose transferase-like glycosyltransferase
VSLRSADGRVLALLTLAFVLSGVAFAVVTPMFENPDEATHVDMVEHYVHQPTKLAGPSLRQTAKVRGAFAATGLVDSPGPQAMAGLSGTRPRYGPFRAYGGDEAATSCPGRTCQNYQFIHPPGWYLAAAPVAWVLEARPFPETVLALRLLNVLLGSVMVACTWSIARSLWPDRSRRALLAAACTACCGPLAAASASVNNDGLMMPMIAVALALMAWMLRRGATVRSAGLLGIAVGLGLLIKGQFLIVAVVAFAAVLLAPTVKRGDRPRALLAYLVPGGIGGLWYLRVILDAHSITPTGGELLAPAAPGPWDHVGFASFFVHRIRDVLDRFPGRYGWQLTNLPGGLLVAVQVGTLALLVGWLVCRRWRRPSADSARVLVMASVPVLLLVASAYTAWQTYHSNGDEHGLAPRYVYGSVPVLSVMVIAALVAIRSRVRMPARASRWVQAGLVVGLGGMGVVVSQVVSAHAMYFTTDAKLLFQRAGIVAPVPHLKVWVVLLAMLWTAAMATVVMLLARPEPGRHAAGR